VATRFTRRAGTPRIGYVLAVAKDHHASTPRASVHRRALAVAIGGPRLKGHRWHDLAWITIEPGRKGGHWRLIRLNRRTRELACHRCW
jgi:hypothetical protein